MTSLCKYADVFGAPGTGAHAYRLGGLAAVDVLLTAALAYATSRALGCRGFVAFAVVFIIWIITGVAAHEAFCVRTRFNAALFGRPWPEPAPTSTSASEPAPEAAPEPKKE